MHHFRVPALTFTSRLLVIVCLLFAAAQLAFSQGDPALRISDVTLREGDDPAVAYSTEFVEISLSAPSTKTVSVTVSTQQGTGMLGSSAPAQSDIDFVSGSSVVTFSPGQTLQLLTVFTKGDTVVEGNEYFYLNLSNPVNATIARGQAVATIIDDDALLLLTQTGSQRAAALDSVTFTQEPFPIINTLNFSSDNRTRISLFAVGLKLSASETASAVTATAEDSHGTLWPLTVEFAGPPAQCTGTNPKFCWLTQVVLKVNDQIPTPGDVSLRISLHGQTSNAVIVGVKSQ